MGLGGLDVVIGETLWGRKPTSFFYMVFRLVTLCTNPMCAHASRAVEDAFLPMSRGRVGTVREDLAFTPWAKVHILVCDVSNLAILDHQPSFRTLAPGAR
jgi:hypothetical protein